MSIYRLENWLKEIVIWLNKGKPMLMCFLVILAALVLGLFTWKSEASIRISGYTLQLVGMIFAVRGLLSVRIYFGQSLLRVLFINWLHQFPKWKRDTIIGAGAATSGMSTMKARVEVWVPDDPQKSIEERIKALVGNQNQVRNELGQHHNLIDELGQSHKEHRKETEKSDKEIKKEFRGELETLHTGDLIVSLVGLVWLTVGISLSTLSPEIFKWVINA